ncbi:PTS system, cellobiose-specific IIC component [Anaerovirgula multivorans]|uniref:Permease IIC component n=1 Tax=Anaerovirgula multivorans TaxID=312168 RepID=A0A239ISR4_9FIRM|nr:PTS transporter subunit EIIC [Anaerovirgula multivorans]SNS96083.1 PTS system, cellobiose-specific IIC component [Anaerovirgula multivorans]
MEMKDFVMEKVVPTANRISANKYLRSISDGFMTLMPVIIIGSIFSLLNSMAIPAYQNFITSIGIKPLLAIPNMVTNDMLALYAVFFIAYCLAKTYDKDPGIAGMIALFTFLAITPIANTGNIINGFLSNNNILLPEGVSVPGGNVLPFDWLGAKGLFVAIIVGLSTAVIYNFLLEKGMAIKMPDGVPPTITKSFAGLAPGFVIIGLFIVLNKVVASIPANGVTGIHSMVYYFVQAPMEMFLGNNLASFLFAIFVAQLLWFFGIHGVAAIILPIFYPLWTSLTMANIEAMNAGVSVFQLPNIINRSFFSAYAVVGGSGITLGLCIYMMLRGKSKQYKTLGKLAFLANICGINEPLVFATPMVLNPYMMIPWIVTPLVSSSLAYVLTAINILPRLTTIIPLGTPIIMSGFLAGGVAGWRVALFQVVIVVISAIVYLPFFRMIDNKAYENEKVSVEA